jgi:4-amino-4-deoxy-L-arabinose transferase-like glycosyltransferase
MIKKKNIFKIFILFLLAHTILWTIIPSISNKNLPLDTIEALAWGSNLDWGFDKHPPFSAFVVELFYKIFGSNDWAYYFLSQIFVAISFFFVWKFSEEIFKEKLLSLLSVLLLEGIFFFNYTTPEFNVNISQLPFWSLSIFYCWKSTETNSFKDWFLFGFFASCGFLSKYLFILLLIALSAFIANNIIKTKKFNYRYFLPVIVFFVILFPHIFWLFDNNFSSLYYGISRTGVYEKNLYSHFLNPVLFFLKQGILLIPMFALIYLLIKKIKFSLKKNDKVTTFLIFINLIPFFLIFLISILTGSKIRTMWMTPFYLFLPTLIIYISQKYIDLKKINSFFISFVILFFLSPSIYLYVSLSDNSKRTDYPGREISYLVQKKWEENFSNEILVVVGDEWGAGNLSYHLPSRPKWFNKLEDKLLLLDSNAGVVYAGNPQVLKKICPGVYGTIKPLGYCMIGKR